MANQVGRSTDRDVVRKAATYRNAARAMERTEYRSCCGAICESHSKRCTCSVPDGPVKSFAAVFRDAGCGTYWWGEPGEQENLDARIFALCLMAAMVEAGDA